jgi:AAA-like domain
MVKKFNDVGLCFPEDHFMADISAKIDATYKMVEEGAYFIINRPRQYGKTTMLYTIADNLIASGQYIVFNISFEGLGDRIFLDETMFAPNFVKLLARDMRFYSPQMATEMLSFVPSVTNLDELSNFITDFASKIDKKAILLIDEVDKSSNNQLFVSFLAMLRYKYLDRKKNKTFHSVVLAGVHDVKSLKLKISPNSEQKYNSPWNIATVFEVDLNLNPSEIKPMLDDYVQEWFANRLFYFTSGYPYLVSRLCKILDENILPKKTVKEWTEEDLNKAFSLILKEEHNANFDTLMKNLEHYPELYELVYSLIFDSERKTYSSDNPVVNLGRLHGILAESETGNLVLQNRIYRERIANMMVSKWQTDRTKMSAAASETFDNISQYRLPNNGLDMQKILTKFQAYMREQHNDKDQKLLEREGRLIFLAFLRPILNGSGFDFKEPQISDERRLDVVITYNQFKYIAELKVWYGPVAHEKGLAQLADYLDRQDLDTGYLLIFDPSKKKTWKKDWKDFNGKRIFWVMV